jgi:molybdopterin/thiamine biosynthesis adenylyltransferase
LAIRLKLKVPCKRAVTTDMAKGPLPGQHRAEAAFTLGEWLTANVAARPLTTKELSVYRDRAFVAGWRLPPVIDANGFELEVLIDASFPHSLATVAVATPLPFPSFPHVEEDGVLCLLPTFAEVDPTEPIGAIKHLLGRAGQVLRAGLLRKNLEDFRSEFLSYWNPVASKIPVRSLLDPSEPSRFVSIWLGARFHVAAENEAALRRWLTQTGIRHRPKPMPRALLLWINEPFLPSEYPLIGPDLWDLVESHAPEQIEWLQRTTAHERGSFVIFGAQTTNGVCFAAVRTSLRSVPGFRPGHAPSHLVTRNVLGASSISRHAVQRLDPFWIHGRDKNGDIGDLIGARVLVLGCGSLGGSVAHLLAQAGVGEQIFVDGDTLSWANTGRHYLGGEWVGWNKALAMKSALSKAFPSARYAAHAQKWQSVEGFSKLVHSCDLVVSTIGSWAEEAELNSVHLQTDRETPVIYGWTEPHAIAGHAVLIGRKGGCFACGLTQFGSARLKVAQWGNDREIAQEPACGAYYQPYGPVALSKCVATVADLALDSLLDRTQTGTERVWASTWDELKATNGHWTSEWLASGGEERGGILRELPWPQDDKCAWCE